MRLVRPLAIAACTAALFGVLLWAVALAQTGDATPAPTPVPVETEPSAYLTLDMKAGFALDPFLVYYGQEARMYALLVLWTVLTFYCADWLEDAPWPLRATSCILSRQRRWNLASPTASTSSMIRISFWR